MDRRLPNQYNLIAFDPGGTIGWAWLVVNFKGFSRPDASVLRHIESWDCGEFTGTEHEQCQQACRLVYDAKFGKVGELNQKTDVVTEDFELTQLIGGKDLLSPVRINAVLDWELTRNACGPLHYQARQMRTSVTPDRLRLFGSDGRWKTSGTGKDAFAAMQHAIVFLRRIKQIAKTLPWKLEDASRTNTQWDCGCAKGRVCDMRHPLDKVFR